MDPSPPKKIKLAINKNIRNDGDGTNEQDLKKGANEENANYIQINDGQEEKNKTASDKINFKQGANEETANNNVQKPDAGLDFIQDSGKVNAEVEEINNIQESRRDTNEIKIDGLEFIPETKNEENANIIERNHGEKEELKTENSKEKTQFSIRIQAIIKKDPDLIQLLFNTVKDDLNLNWTDLDLNQSYKSVPLEEETAEYKLINQQFLDTTRNHIVEKIFRVENPYLLIQFQLARLKNPEKKVTSLFHGTSNGCIESICINNFDWRVNGESCGHLYGRGISFAHGAYYSAFYGRDNRMFVTDVLLEKSCIGNSHTELPEKDCDHSKNPQDTVIIKYDDNQFYPKHIVWYKKRWSF